MLKQIGIRLEEELIKKIKIKSAEDNSTMQETITKALEQYLAPKLQVRTVDHPKYTVDISHEDMIKFSQASEAMYRINRQVGLQRRG